MVDDVSISSSEMSKQPGDIELPPQPSTPPSLQSSEQIVSDDNDSEYSTDHDTLGLHWEDEANKGGVLPNATSNVCVIYTKGNIVPFQSIKIPKINESDEVAPQSTAFDPNGPSGLTYNPSRPGNAQIILGESNRSGDHRSGSSRISDMDNSSYTFNNPTNDNMTNEERIDIATKNLQAGLVALDNAEFDAAAVCFLLGRGQLGPHGWSIDFKLMLKLTGEAANAAYITGDFDNMNTLINEVLSIEGISVKDKFRVYEVKILAEQGRICVNHKICAHLMHFLYSRCLYPHTLHLSILTTNIGAGNYHESIALGIDVRKQLGLKTPKDKKTSVLTILKGYLKTKWLLGNRSAEELAKLPELKNERFIMGQRILELMEISCYQAQPTMFALLVFLLMDTSLIYGINASTCDAFTGFGVILCGGFGKIKQGREMAKAAELIMSKPEMKRCKSRTIFVCEGLINHWSKPLRETLDPLLEGYRVGLESGDGQSAGICQSLHVTHTFYCGMPLEGDIAAEMVASIPPLKDDKSAVINPFVVDTSAVESVELQNDTSTVGSVIPTQAQEELGLHVIYLLGSKRLRGKEVEPEEQNFDEILQVAAKADNQSLCGYIYAGHMEIKVIFGEWEGALKLAGQAGSKPRAALVATFTGIRFTFLVALIYVKAAQLIKTDTITRSKCKMKAMKEIRTIRKWVKRGNPNVVHSLHLLEAELASLNGKHTKAEQHFKYAIDTAEKNGFLQDQALSNEMASSYYKRRGDEPIRKRPPSAGSNRDYHLKQAIECYSRWGATAKARELSDMLPDNEASGKLQSSTEHSNGASTPPARMLLQYPTIRPVTHEDPVVNILSSRTRRITDVISRHRESSSSIETSH